MTTFSDFNLPEVVNNSLNRMKYEKPTPIQAKAIPLALEGKDILGSAQTGTGKTAAFAIPLITYLMKNESETALVLMPTRELAVQVIDIMRQLIGPGKTVRTALLIGGAPMHRQLEDLKRRPRLIVGTPGRINDHLGRGRLHLDKTSFLVLDETDRMLDMGFGVQIDEILKHMPYKRQTLMFSATLPKAIVRVSEKYLKNPERVAIGSTTDVAKNVKQDMIRVATSDKYDMLLSQVADRKGSIIIFVKTKRGADKMADRLRNENFKANAIHGDLRQRQRDRVIKQFREKQYRILVATDVAARGLDIPHIEHVINYNLPQCPEDYIHRIGRTARAGAQGEALCIVSPDENSKWHAIARMLDPNTADDGGNEQNGRKRSHNGRRKQFSQRRGSNSNGGGRDFVKGRGQGGNGGGYRGKKSFGDRNERSDDSRGNSENRGGRSFGGNNRGDSRGGENRYSRNNDRNEGGRSFDRNRSDDRRNNVENRGRSSDGYQKGPRKYGEERVAGKQNFDAGKRRREEGRRARDGEERSHGQKRDFNPSRSENRGNSNGGRGRSFNENRGGNGRSEGGSFDRNRSDDRRNNGENRGGRSYGGNNRGGENRGGQGRSEGRSYDRNRSDDRRGNGGENRGGRSFGGNSRGGNGESRGSGGQRSHGGSGKSFSNNRSRPNNRDGQKPARRRNAA